MMPNNAKNARLPRFFCAWAIYPHPCPFIAICARFKRLLNTIAAPLSQGSLKNSFQAAFLRGAIRQNGGAAVPLFVLF